MTLGTVRRIDLQADAIGVSEENASGSRTFRVWHDAVIQQRHPQGTQAVLGGPNLFHTRDLK
jgi:hypothetical protein